MTTKAVIGTVDTIRAGSDKSAPRSPPVIQQSVVTLLVLHIAVLQLSVNAAR